MEAASEVVTTWRQFEKGDLSAPELLDFLLTFWNVDVLDEDAPSKFTDRFVAAASLIEDDGLRALLQHSLLKRFPKTVTHCCAAPHCFRCKVATHHEGLKCEEVQRRQVPEDGVQFCPGCGVATVKTEGCNHMICLCGEDWTWEGSETWVAEWTDE